jgi:hypothetical protein
VSYGQYPLSQGGRRPPPQPATPATVHRTGWLGWWVDLTAPPLPANWASLPAGQSERLRKAQLTSYSILAVALFLATLFSNSIADPGTASAVVLMAVFLLITALLNRFGVTRVAAFVIPSALTLLTMLAVLSAPGGIRLVVLPAYDLFVIPIFIASLTADWRAPWVFVVLACTFIAGDWALQQHALVTATGVDLTRTKGFDELARETAIFTSWGMISRDLALAVFAGLFSSLGAFSVERAIVRADQAERVAALEHERAEQRQVLEEGAGELLQAHVRIANGDFKTRVPSLRDPLLWQVGQSLNNVVARMQAALNAAYQLQRTQEELQRLEAAVRDAQSGRQPIWPSPAGTPADGLITLLSSRGLPSGTRQVQPPAPGISSQYPGAQQSSRWPEPGGGDEGGRRPRNPWDPPYSS